MSGRWTEEEHDLFLKGLHEFGKNWVAVAEIVKTRNTIQVRSHAQKHFIKEEKNEMQAQGGGGMQHSKRHKPATIEELRLAIPMIDDRGRLVSPPGDASEASSKGGSSSAFSPPSSAAAAAAVAAAAAASDEPAAALSSAASAAFSSSPSLESASDLATMPPPRPVLKPGASSSVDPKNLDRVPQELSTDKQQPGILLPPPPATNPDLAATCSSFDVVDDATFNALAS